MRSRREAFGRSVGVLVVCCGVASLLSCGPSAVPAASPSGASSAVASSAGASGAGPSSAGAGGGSQAPNQVAPAGPGRLVVAVDSFRTDDGVLRCTLFAGAEGFPEKGEKALKKASA